MSIEDLRKFASTRHGVFTPRQALEYITRNQLSGLRRRGEVVRKAPGVWKFEYCERSWKQDVVIAMSSLPPTATLCQKSALKLHGVGSFDDVPITVAVPRGRHGKIREFNVIYRDIPFRQRQVKDGIALTTIERFLVDVAPIVGAKQLSELVDEVLFRRLASIHSIESLLSKVPVNTAGIALLRRDLARRNENDRRLRSRFEREVLTDVRLAGLPEPIVEYKIIYDTETYLPDFAWPERKVIVEVDGGHHDNPLQLRKDRLRRNRLASLGWTILHFGDETNIVIFLAQLLRLLTSQAS